MSDTDDRNRRRSGERKYLFDMLAQLAKLADGCVESTVARVVAALISNPGNDARAPAASMVCEQQTRDTN